MIKLIHTADVHLDSPLKSLALRNPDLREKVQCASRSAFTRIVEQAIDQNVAAVLIAGDLFDGASRSAKTAAFLLAELERLNQQGIQVFYIKGNHDAENPLTGETTLPENVYVFSGDGGKVQLSLSGQSEEESSERRVEEKSHEIDIWIHGVSFSERTAEKSLLDKFSEPVPNAINIGILHTSLSGSASHDVYAPCSVQQLIDVGFDYWALGHIHKRQVHSEGPWIVMPGIPQGRDVGEPGPQSATLISIGAPEDQLVGEGVIAISEFLTSNIEFTTVRLDVSALDAATALQPLVRGALQDLVDDLQSEDAVVRIRLEGQNTLRWQWLRDRDQWEETVSLLCRETGRLWMEKLVFDIDDTTRTVADTTALGELAGLMSTIRQEDAFSDEAALLIDEILATVPASERAKLLPNERSRAELAATLSKQGEQHLLAMMKGVGADTDNADTSKTGK